MVKKLICIGVMLVMVFSFVGCGNGFREKKTKDMIELHTWYITSGVPNNAIKLSYSDENAVFECIVDEGNFRTGFQYSKNKSAKHGDTIYWVPWETDLDGEPTSAITQAERTFVEIILKVDDNIIGYAVIKIERKGDSRSYNAKILKSALIPKVDGEYQNVTKEQIKNAIEKIKK